MPGRVERCRLGSSLGPAPGCEVLPRAVQHSVRVDDCFGFETSAELIRPGISVGSSQRTPRYRLPGQRIIGFVDAVAPLLVVSLRTGAIRNVGGSVTRHRAEARADPLAER
jgi:hypothetical protein